jgi:hypothetical protein
MRKDAVLASFDAGQHCQNVCLEGGMLNINHKRLEGDDLVDRERDG